MTTTIPISTITFPEIRLPQRAAVQLRGYFGTMFREHSPLLHNHYEDGRLRYAYPLVQYKVIEGTPMLLGLNDGASLLAELFFRIKTLQIHDRHYPVMERDISFRHAPIGMSENLENYEFRTLWMPLNQQIYPDYLQKNPDERRAMLGRVLTGHMLSCFKGLGLFLPEGIRVMSTFRPREEKLTAFKDQLMTGITGGFTSNVLLPDFIGLGKSVARGFGSIQKI